MDLIKEGIKFSIGQTNEINVHYSYESCAVRILGAAHSGKIKKIADLEDFIPAEDIIEVCFDCSKGDKADVFDNGANRLGHVIFKSKTVEQIEEKICSLDDIFVLE